MGGLMFLGLIAIVFLVVAGVCFSKIESIGSPAFLLGALFLLLGTLVLFMFSLISKEILKDGSPVTQITPGIYKVGFVYYAGGNVSIGIEKTIEKTNEKKGEEELSLYQFPMKDFEGNIPLDASKLVAYKIVTNEGTFNRYKLEYNIIIKLQ